MRINARLDKDHSQKLEYLTRRTGSNISGVIKQAIEAYYDLLTNHKRKSSDILYQSGFIGSAEGVEDLSQNYKQVHQHELEKKGDHC